VRSLSFSLVTWSVTIAACSTFVSLDGLSVPDGNDAAMPEAGMPDTMMPPADGAPPDTGACPVLEGPAMVRVDNYCVDSTEVTRAQYQKFLDAKVDPSKQDSPCAWNADFTPSTW